MKIACPACKAIVPASNLNVSTDVAVCENCQEAFAISSILATGQGLAGFDIHDPPRGAWFEDTGMGWTIGGTTRSALAFFIVPFMCIWSGGSLGGIYGSQILAGEFNIFLSLFGIPFLLGSVGLGAVAAMSVCGKVVVSVEGSDGRVFEGVGPFGWTRRFDWRSITAVEEDSANTRHARGSNCVIALVGQARLKFGSMLSDPRRFYFMQALRTQLANRI